MNDQTKVFPAFVFERQRHFEIEAGFVLAGHLVVDLPEGGPPSDEQAVVGPVVIGLVEWVATGKMPDDALIFAWWGGCKPLNAVDTTDHALMSAWAARSLGIILRIGPVTDADHLMIDMDALGI